MGFQGQLQELPFVDILQLVAFSQKNGYLFIDSPFGRGSVVFRDGKVVCAYAWSMLDTRKVRKTPSSWKWSRPLCAKWLVFRRATSILRSLKG